MQLASTEFGLEVYWDGDARVQVVVPEAFKGRMCGLCGDFNNLAEDDWRVGPACPQDTGTVVRHVIGSGTSCHGVIDVISAASEVM